MKKRTYLLTLIFILVLASFVYADPVQGEIDLENMIYDMILGLENDSVLEVRGGDAADFLEKIKEDYGYYDLDHIVDKLIEKKLSPFYIENTYIYYPECELNEGSYIIKMNNKIFNDREDVEYARNHIKNKIKNFKADSDEEILREAYNTVINDLEYKKHYDNSNEEGLYIERNIKSGIDGKGVVCHGYALYMGLFLDELGYENTYIRGYTGDKLAYHIWNAVKLKGNWYLIDATWGDRGNEADYRYFLRGTNFFNASHIYELENLKDKGIVLSKLDYDESFKSSKFLKEKEKIGYELEKYMDTYLYMMQLIKNDSLDELKDIDLYKEFKEDTLIYDKLSKYLSLASDSEDLNKISKDLKKLDKNMIKNMNSFKDNYFVSMSKKRIDSNLKIESFNIDDFEKNVDIEQEIKNHISKKVKSLPIYSNHRVEILDKNFHEIRYCIYLESGKATSKSKEFSLSYKGDGLSNVSLVKEDLDDLYEICDDFINKNETKVSEDFKKEIYKDLNKLDKVNDEVFEKLYSKLEMENYIINMREKESSYIRGYEDKTFRGDNYISREEVASIISELLPSIEIKENNFVDIKNTWSKKSIDRVYSSGIISGYPDGRFRPREAISRAEALVILLKYDNVNLESSNKKHWAQNFIDYGFENNIIKGYENGDFKANNKITRAEFVVMVNKILKREKIKSNPGFIDIKGKWYKNEVLKAI